MIMNKYLLTLVLIFLAACSTGLDAEEIEIAPKAQTPIDSLSKDTLKVGN
jgi:hypothetical protein